MLQLKKTAAALLAINSSVFAGAMGPVCAPGNVTVPCQITFFDFGAQYLYLRPNLSPSLTDLGSISTVTSNSLNFQTPNGVQPNILTNNVNQQLKWSSDFMLESSYHFRTGNDATVNWYHYSQGEVTPFTVNLFNIDFSGPEELLSIQNITTGHSNLRTKWDAVNFELAQHVDFGTYASTRFHGGVQVARVDVNRVVLFNTLDSIGDTTLSGNSALNTRSNLFGPRIGADLDYAVTNGFALEGKAAASLLIGMSKGSVVVPVLTSSANSILAYQFANFSKTTVLPELEAKLGANYTFSFSSGMVTVNAGYMWLTYFNATPSYSYTFNTDTAYGVQGREIEEGVFSLDGVYVGAKWMG